MMYQMPIIASRWRGVQSVVNDGENGFLIPPFDINLFAEKVILLMRDHELRYKMGENAQKTASLYEIDRIGQQWKSLFEELKAR